MGTGPRTPRALACLPMDDAPENVLELAGACVAAVANATKIELDFTQDTLPILDHYMSTAKGPRAEILGLVAPMCGAYFGEVVRRSLGPARWHAPDDEYAGYRLEFERFFLWFNPIDIALEALLERSVDEQGAALGLLPRDRAAVERAVDLYGDVREDDYYRLAMRYEVIEQVVETLRNRASAEAPVLIGPDVYLAAVGDAVDRGEPS